MINPNLSFNPLYGDGIVEIIGVNDTPVITHLSFHTSLI